MTHTFDYEGHSVTIIEEQHRKGMRYWFSVDGHVVTFAKNLDTSKRLATRFIDVVNDAYFKHSKQMPLYKPGIC